MKALRVATICHNMADHKDKNHRRVRIELRKTEDGFCWFSGGDDCGVGTYETVNDACVAAKAAWGQDIWAMKSKW